MVLLVHFKMAKGQKCIFAFMLKPAIKILIEQRLGVPVKYPRDCNALQHHIYSVCKKQVSTSTLKRLFGFVKNIKQSHKHTLDVIAQYVGHKNWEDLNRFMENPENSSFFQVDGIEASKLKIGNQVEFTYDPNRVVLIKYLGKNTFEVIEAKNSKLHRQDKIICSHIVLNHPLIVIEVLRNKAKLGKFTAGKLNGVTGIKVIY